MEGGLSSRAGTRSGVRAHTDDVFRHSWRLWRSAPLPVEAVRHRERMSSTFVNLQNEGETLRRVSSLLAALRKGEGRDFCTSELETVIDGMRRAASVACALHHSAIDRLEHASKVFELAARDGDGTSREIRRALVYELRVMIERIDAQPPARPRSGYSALAAGAAALSATSR